MSNIDALIKKLEEAKEELSKNVNCAPGGEANALEKDSANPALAPKQVKVKELQGKIDSGTYKPNPEAIADKMLKKEELSCSENGQWDIKKWNMEKRCWEGYEPTPGKEAHEDGSCKEK